MSTVSGIKEEKSIFIDCYTETYGAVAPACRITGISRWTFYDWCKKDTLFCKKLKLAIENKFG